MIHKCPVCEFIFEAEGPFGRKCDICDIDKELCRECGGKCCKVFAYIPEEHSLDETIKLWESILRKVPKNYPKTYEIKDYLNGTKSVPVECPYLGIEGCMIGDRKDRPKICLEYRCKKWGVQ